MLKSFSEAVEITILSGKGYQNEDIIDEWELGQTIYFRPKEILLQGIKPYEEKW